jgi:hypothetical protein
MNHYVIEAEPRVPDLEAERRYVFAEMARVRHELRPRRGRHWPWFSYPRLGILRRKDWQGYLKQLQNYEKALDDHQRQMGHGFLPFMINVMYNGDRPDYNVRVTVTVTDGEINDKLKGPDRPKRIDGELKSPKKGRLRWVWGFMRSGVHIEPTAVGATFSRLDPHDRAVLLQPVLYLHMNEQTRLHYEVRSRRAKHERGEIPL